MWYKWSVCDLSLIPYFVRLKHNILGECSPNDSRSGGRMSVAGIPSLALFSFSWMRITHRQSIVSCIVLDLVQLQFFGKMAISYVTYLNIPLWPERSERWCILPSWKQLNKQHGERTRLITPPRVEWCRICSLFMEKALQLVQIRYKMNVFSNQIYTITPAGIGNNLCILDLFNIAVVPLLDSPHYFPATIHCVLLQPCRLTMELILWIISSALISQVHHDSHLFCSAH